VSGMPLIGICAAIERVSWGAWTDLEVVHAPRNYGRAIAAAGGLPVVLAPELQTEAELDALLDRIDGVLLAGGADVDPSSYGADPDPHTKGTWPERDTFEISLMRRALEREMPVLGICRGMQLINVAQGGTLDQHVPERVGHERHREMPGTFSRHRVQLEPGSLAERASGATGSGEVFSHHHQGIERLGDGLAISGRAADEETIEAIELPGAHYALGVLWHPEEDETSPVIGSLVDAARVAMAGREVIA
jgi:putative glutamine amidotransferase